jgi:hypothetical protein
MTETGSGKEERPEIELYMYSLNQEFAVGKGHRTFLKRHSDVYQDASGKLVGVEQVAAQVYLMKEAVADWIAQWVHNQWVQNYVFYPGGAGFGRPELPMSSLIVRSESFGGIAFDPKSDRVYKVNVPGYRLLQEILQAHREGKLAEFRSKEFESQDVERFVSFLKGAGLWPS